MAIYEKPVRELIRDMVADLSPSADHVFSRQQAYQWFQQRYPKVKLSTIACHLTRFSTNAASRFHYNAKSGEEDLLFQIDPNRFRLFDPRNDPAPVPDPNGATSPPVVNEECGTGGNASEFAYEHDLRDYLAKHLHLIEPGLRLFEEDDITGIEFPAGGRFIDILAIDRSNNYVVIELKVSRGYDRVVGQLLRYMAWIEQNQADSGQRVRGIVIARELSEDLRLACSRVADVELFEYQMSVTLRRVAVTSPSRGTAS